MSDADAIRNGYAALGVAAYYAQHGATYRNPHEPLIRELLDKVVPAWGLDLTRVLDLACGSGEATLALRDHGAKQIDGVDPYTGTAYTARTGQAARALFFEDIAAGVLNEQTYSLIVCSFALHLAARSRLPLLCIRLAETAPALLVITPHKRPDIRAAWGWQLHAEALHARVRARYYQRTNAQNAS
ncbi:MAG: methyltransferase domain-containing protein [Anaerolineales bacterium]